MKVYVVELWHEDRESASDEVIGVAPSAEEAIRRLKAVMSPSGNWWVRTTLTQDDLTVWAERYSWHELREKEWRVSADELLWVSKYWRVSIWEQDTEVEMRWPL